MWPYVEKWSLQMELREGSGGKDIIYIFIAGSNSNDKYPYVIDIQKRKQTRKRASVKTDCDWSLATSQGSWVTTRSCKRQRIELTFLHCRLLDSRTIQEYIFVVLSHKVCGIFLQQPQGVNSTTFTCFL